MDFSLLPLEIGLSLRAEVGHFVNVLLHGLQLVLDLSLGLLGFGTNSEDFEIFLTYLLFIFQNISIVKRIPVYAEDVWLTCQQNANATGSLLLPI